MGAASNYTQTMQMSRFPLQLWLKANFTKLNGILDVRHTVLPEGIHGVLFENRPAVYFCNYKENKKNNIRMLDTLFIGDFMDSMEQYFHF